MHGSRATLRRSAGVGVGHIKRSSAVSSTALISRAQRVARSERLRRGVVSRDDLAL